MSDSAIVFCTGGGIGDVLLATPVMRALRMRYERVVALTAPVHREVLLGNPDLAEVWTDDGTFGSLAGRIASERFSTALVTWATPRSAALPFLARVPRRVGQARRLYSALFTDRVVIRSELGDHSTHWTQILLDYARRLECDVVDPTPTFIVQPEAEIAGKRLLVELGVNGAYVVLHPTRGIAAARDRWPLAVFVALVRALTAAFDVQVVVSGGSLDAPIAQAIAEEAKCISIAGRMTIAEYAAIARDACCVVAMDSGPMHIAAAVGAPTVGIFALRSDEPERWRPMGPRTAVVRGTYPCPPSHRKETCPDFACIVGLNVPAVIQTAKELLGK
ncbi:MAG TPA: glycosyltransferase family 9 protein [Candidatus Baltobacteraceae bacterium]|jgi:ADP-heptose:LPS heptosyltransferase|nr:glycosyltransferase family 9 protein [Candidatus Baltobacteraceae bacterium]